MNFIILQPTCQVKKKTECLSTQGQSLPLISLRFDFALMGIKWYNLFWGDNTKMMKKKISQRIGLSVRVLS